MRDKLIFALLLSIFLSISSFSQQIPPFRLIPGVNGISIIAVVALSERSYPPTIIFGSHDFNLTLKNTTTNITAKDRSRCKTVALACIPAEGTLFAA